MTGEDGAAATGRRAVLECVVNVSCADPGVIGELGRAGGDCLLDVHSDRYHNRSVVTLAGAGLELAVRAVARRTVELVDLHHHVGVHPRLGVLDVVPFAPITTGDVRDLATAVEARDRFATFASDELELPCFVYGPERTLPEIRRGAFSNLFPDYGPSTPHPSAGACCVGARAALVAFNLVLDGADLAAARTIAREIRDPAVRALGLPIGDEVQVSCNLVRPSVVGPAALYDRVASRAAIRRCELVGLVPRAVLAAVPPDRRELLDLSESRTVEARCEQAGIALNSN